MVLTCSKRGDQGSHKTYYVEINLCERGKGDSTHYGNKGEVNKSGGRLTEDQNLQDNSECRDKWFDCLHEWNRDPSQADVPKDDIKAEDSAIYV